MIKITKEESMALRAKYGDGVNIAITNRHKRGGRKHYYAPEENRIKFFIERFRNKQTKKFEKRKVSNAG